MIYLSDQGNEVPLCVYSYHKEYNGQRKEIYTCESNLSHQHHLYKTELTILQIYQTSYLFNIQHSDFLELKNIYSRFLNEINRF